MVIKSKSSIELRNIENSFERKKHVWFSGMDKLDTLNLNNNKIEELGPRFFEGDSSHNLESTGDHFCSGVPRVTSLKLDYNKINKIHDEAFYGLEGWQKHIWSDA